MPTKIWVSDFECKTTAPTCVWLWGKKEILSERKDKTDFLWGTDLDSYIESFDKDCKNNHIVYTHNLKYDGGFVLDWLFCHGYTWKEEIQECEKQDFTTLITGDGTIYAITIVFSRSNDGKKIRKLTIYDSFKLFEMPVKEIAETFELPMSKGTIDYERHNTECDITQEEIEYLRTDIEIVAAALEIFADKVTLKTTIASCAMRDYKSFLKETGGFNKTESAFRTFFPKLKQNVDNELRCAFKGGYCRLNPDYINKDIEDGIEIDCNNMYGYILHDKMLPYGEPKRFEGMYEEDIVYPLYTQTMLLSFKLKEDGVPFLQVKGFWGGNNYLVNSISPKSDIDEPMYITLTNMELDMLIDNYDVTIYQFCGGYKFKATDKLFKGYIDYWNEVAEKAREEKNQGLKHIAKKMMVSLFGKFGLKPTVSNKKPLYNEQEKKVDYRNIEYVRCNQYGEPVVDANGEVMMVDKKVIEPMYLPVALFTTAYGREIIINAIQKLEHEAVVNHTKSRFIYCDTDSLHLKGFELPRFLHYDNTEMGKFKIVTLFEKARFLRPKMYIEQEYLKGEAKAKGLPTEFKFKLNELGEVEKKIKVAATGWSVNYRADVSYEDFKDGCVFKTLSSKTVEGGVILEEKEFELSAIGGGLVKKKKSKKKVDKSKK